LPLSKVIGLSSFTIFAILDGISTLVYGHYRLKEDEEVEVEE